MLISQKKPSTLNSVEVLNFFAELAGGEYLIDYSDSTHMRENEWTELATLSITDGFSRVGTSEVDWSTNFSEVNQSYRVTVQPKYNGSEADDINRLLLDQLSQCLVRSGLILPVMSNNSLREIMELQKQKSILIIPDTNALSNGSVHWLLSAMPSTHTHLVPITISMHQIQEHDRRVKSLANKRKPQNIRAAIRSRALVNNALSMLDLCPQNYQVLEVPPELLRYVRPTSSKLGEQDETDVLEDRLLIEAIHQILRSTRSRSPKLVVTADVTLSRILHSEAIPFLSLLVPIIETGAQFASVSFDPVARKFRGASFAQLLWTMMQTFSEVRVRAPDGRELAKMSLYWPAKTVDDWIEHRFIFSTELPADRGDSLKVVSQENSTVDSVLVRALPAETSAVLQPLSTLAVPNISMLPVIQVASLLEASFSPISDLLHSAQKLYSMSETATKNAAEFLSRADFAVYNEHSIRGTTFAETLRERVDCEDLDGVSSLFEETFPPYRLLRCRLQKYGSLPNEMTSDIREEWLNSSKVAYRSLKPFLVYLGQAWIDKGITVDGSQRPSDDDFIQQLVTIISDKDFLSVKEIIRSLTFKLRMSPWAVRRQLELVSSTNSLSHLRFDSATASELAYGDKVLRGPFNRPELEALVISSIYVGGKPIFTVARA